MTVKTQVWAPSWRLPSAQRSGVGTETEVLTTWDMEKTLSLDSVKELWLHLLSDKTDFWSWRMVFFFCCCRETTLPWPLPSLISLTFSSISFHEMNWSLQSGRWAVRVMALWPVLSTLWFQSVTKRGLTKQYRTRFKRALCASCKCLLTVVFRFFWFSGNRAWVEIYKSLTGIHLSFKNC